MAFTLKLDIYSFEIKKITEIIDNSSSEDRMKIKTEKNISPFDALFTDLESSMSDEKDVFSFFLKKLLADFDGKFKKNNTNTHAISIVDDSFNSFNRNSNTIWGKFKGGITGINRKIYADSNSIDPKAEIGSDDVSSVEYFFMLWIPRDSSLGILMVQSYTELGSVTSFRQCITDYFISIGYKPVWVKYIPQQYLNEFLNHGVFNKVKIVHAKKFSDKHFDAQFEAFKESKHTSFIDNFNISLSSLINKSFGMIQTLNKQIGCIIPDFDEDKDSVVLFYQDEHGKRARANLEDVDKFLPIITLEDSLKDENNVPRWIEIKSFSDSLLKKIKSEIGYTPNMIP